MKQYRHFLSLLLALTTCLTASAQMEIDDLAGSDRKKAVSFADSIRQQSIKGGEYYSRNQYRYERAQIRKERNNLEISGGLQGSLTNLNEPWIETSGGDNTVTLLSTLYLKHIFTKDLFSLQTTMSAKFGYYRMMLETELDDGDIESNPVWYKNQDEFQMEVTPSIKISKNWSYGASVKFRTQFAKGYVSSASQEGYNLKSDFMSPGYLDISGGMIYNCPSEKYPVTVTVSPVAMSAVYVTNSEVKENAQYAYKDPEVTTESYVKPYGVDPYSSSKYEGGSSIQIDFDRKFGKNDFLRYTTTIYSFYGWMTQVSQKNIYGDVDEYEAALEEWEVDKDEIEPMLSIHPTVRWENKLQIQASKLLSTTLNFQIYYNRAQCTKVQTQTLLSVGLAYTFKNK